MNKLKLNAVLSTGLLGLAFSASTSLAQVGPASKFPARRSASAAAQPASGSAKTPGAPSYTYTVLSVPGSLSTYAIGINPGGTSPKIEIVGVGGPQAQGFLATVSAKKTTSETFQTLNYPHHSDEVSPFGINDSGQVVGHYVNSSGAYIGFEKSGGKFTTIAVPFAGATNTTPIAINDAGEIVGAWTDSAEVSHSFTLIGGTYTSFDYPGATFTQANAVNSAGEIVGYYNDTSDVSHGFLLSGGTYVSIDVPGAASTMSSGINDSGDIVGAYCPTGECILSEEGTQGFLLSGGVFTPIAIPGEFATFLIDINNSGVILGDYFDAAGLTVSFLATP
jgi:hypothetical protein